MSSGSVHVTRPSLPPLDALLPYLEKIWASRVLTNGGQFHSQLEAALCEYLGVAHISVFNNGTNALMTAVRALGLCGEVITTPFTFVATAHALMWNSVAPVFVDIDEATLNIDASKIEAAITPATTGILGVHCYGQPCDVEAIDVISKKHGLRVLYDGAHAFGVSDHGESILNHGDMSVLSFHATKVFNTFEGGAIVCGDSVEKRRVDELRNFGFVAEGEAESIGLNGKMSEFNAALGLLQLEYVNTYIRARREVDRVYRTLLAEVNGITCLAAPGAEGNGSYFPILVEDDFHLSRDQLNQHLRDHNVFARRYFFPLISDLPMYRELPSATPSNLTVARNSARRVLCLPMYPDLSVGEVERIVDLFRENRVA